jgi:hypothetical protein
MRKRMRGAISRAVVITVILGASAFTAVRARLEAAQSTGAVPERFGLGVFTTEAWDFFVAFTPDQRTAYFGRANGSFSYFTILETQQRNGRWSPPETAPFSGRWSDSARADYDIWVVDRQPKGSWSAPRHLPAPVNLDGVTEWSPSVASNGNLYFGAVRPGGKGGNDLYVARWNGTVYGEPENLGDSINTARGEVEPWIAPDESYMIFSGQNRTDGLGGFDLYVAERRGGVWEKARILPPPINSVAGDFNQSVSPDGKWLYFSSTRSVFDTIPKRRLTYSEIQRRLTSSGNGLGDIYRVPMSAIIK